jgi:acyl-CoA synthetase (AMP-forming)/AMP-acid ligase II
LDDKGAVADSVTYRGLEDASSALAEQLRADGLGVGERALLVFFPGLDFSVTVLACFKAGVIAVPVFPPDPRKLEKDLHHFISIQRNSGAKVALCHQKYNYIKKIAGIKEIFSKQEHKWPELRYVYMPLCFISS